MSNIYDLFRGVQSKKDACHDERSAAFIVEGNTSNEVTHVRLNATKKVALIFNDKEGPDDVYVFSKIEPVATNNFKKGDYFLWNDTYFLIYEDVKLTNPDLIYKKQRAVECNVVFTVGIKSFYGAFFSSLRKVLDNDLMKSSVLTADEQPFIIAPRDNSFVTGVSFIIENKPWKIKDYDNITNKGISYLYLEKYMVETETVVPVAPFMALGAAEAIDEVETLQSVVEHTIETRDAYFASVPKVDVLERKKTHVKISIPYGIDNVMISTKNSDGNIQEVIYKVVNI